MSTGSERTDADPAATGASTSSGPGVTGSNPTGAAAPPPETGADRLRTLMQGRMRSAGIVAPFTVLFITLSIASASFLTKANLLNIVDQQASTLMIAAAGTLVFVSGGIDLSIGSIYGLGSVISGELVLHSWPAGIAILVAVLAGLAAGTINGVIATQFRINSLIATLATSFILYGISSLVTGGNLLLVSSYQAFGQLANTKFLGVFTSTWSMVVLVVVLGLLLARTTTGRYMYAAGGNPEAARLAGVRVNLVRVIAFALSGGAAALGGIVDSSRVFSSAATQNTTLTFTVIAAIVVGGTSILGGEGVVWRSALGVLFIALIGNGIVLLGIDPLYETITLGVIMLLAVGLDSWSRSRGA